MCALVVRVSVAFVFSRWFLYPAVSGRFLARAARYRAVFPNPLLRLGRKRSGRCLALVEPVVEAVLEAEAAVAIVLDHRRRVGTMIALHAAVAHVVDLVRPVRIATPNRHTAVARVRVVPRHPIVGRKCPHVVDSRVRVGERKMHGHWKLLGGQRVTVAGRRMTGHIDVTGIIRRHLGNRLDVAPYPPAFDALVAVPELRGEVFAHVQLCWCQLLGRLRSELLFPRC